MNREQRARVAVCVDQLQDALYISAREHGATVLIAALARIVGASLRSLIQRGKWTPDEARRLVRTIERIALGADEPPTPPGEEIPIEEDRRAA